jgi:hypothetical protein
MSLTSFVAMRRISRIVIAGAFLFGSSVARATVISLGQAANYAVLGMGGTSGSHGELEVYQSATIVNGNVGAGPYCDWTHGMDATIRGPSATAACSFVFRFTCPLVVLHSVSFPLRTWRTLL